jgi:carbonic anhydrase
MRSSPGTCQSPIDIIRADVEARSGLPPFCVQYPTEPVPVEVCLAVVDGDDTPDGVVAVPEVIVSAPDSGAYVTVGGTRYDLQSFHWHTPSEHLIDGAPLPLELHLVHRSPDGALLVLGVLSVAGDADEAILPAFVHTPSLDPAALAPGTRDCRPAVMALADLVPESPATYRYDGSLTTAPFTEGVSWIVCRDIGTASPEQIDAHMALVSAPLPGYAGRPHPPGNARPIQDRNDRLIVTEA